MTRRRSVKKGDQFFNKEGVKALYVRDTKPRHGIFNISGIEVEKRISDVKNGSFKCNLYPSVCGKGFIGYGDFSSKSEGKHFTAYSCWRSMIKRCYDEKDSHYKSYGGSGVVVADEWLNYQNFAKWYYENLNKITYQYRPEIDKDILGQGKLYSKNTCTLIPRGLNSMVRNLTFSKDIRNKHKLFDSRVSILGERYHIRGFRTKEQAVYARRYVIVSVLNKLLSYLDDLGALSHKGLYIKTPSNLCEMFNNEDLEYLDNLIENISKDEEEHRRRVEKWLT